MMVMMMRLVSLTEMLMVTMKRRRRWLSKRSLFKNFAVAADSVSVLCMGFFLLFFLPLFGVQASGLG